ncbi:MAG TPA: hypothetical protein PL048_00830, partial [Leptospiraceae bacterium]|nr:hypothetical protein [Leptospiraceae bacterium]
PYFLNDAGIDDSGWKTASAEQCLSFILSLGVSVRYRFSRNLRGFHFPGRSNRERIKEDSVNFLIKKAAENQFQYRLNDEDHLRIFRFIQRTESVEDILYIPDIFQDRDIFCFLPRLGFVSSCPTNLGNGNKLSVRLKVPYSKKIILSSLFHFFDIGFSDFNQTLKSFTAEISAKNLNQRNLTAVLRFLSSFIQFVGTKPFSE